MANSKKTIGSGKPLKGSKSPGIGYIYLLFIMFLAIAMGTVMTGGFVPVDPTGPAGPPTLEPYFDPQDYGEQKIILPTGALTPDPKGNLQLKTFTVNTCGQKTALLFVIDTSGSMQFEDKMSKAKGALKAFTNKLPGKAAIGMVTFSAQVQTRVPLSYYKDVKQQVSTTINGLKPNGVTVTRSAMSRAKQLLTDAIKQDKFPGYHYAMILMTDGVPEILPPRTCYKEVQDPLTAPLTRCFAIEQDPRVPTNIAQEINNLGVPIYTIGLYSENSTDRFFKTDLEKLLKEVSSQPTDTHYFSSPKAENLTKIFDDLITNICEEQKVK